MASSEGTSLFAPFYACSDFDRDPTHPRRPTEFRFRNYDPASSAPRKHEKETDEGETVEKAVEGVMERARQEDEARRAAELASRLAPRVFVSSPALTEPFDVHCVAGLDQHPT